MTKRTAILAISTILISACAGSSNPENGQIQAPLSFIQEGTCPGEYCQIGNTWTALEDIPVYAQEGLKQEVAFILTTNEEFETKTGNTHVTPGVVLIKKQHQAFHQETGEEVHFEPGDTVYVLDYQSEGYFQVQHNKEMYSAQVPFTISAAEQNYAERLEMILENKQTWWVQVTNKKGETGWIDTTDKRLKGDNAYPY